MVQCNLCHEYMHGYGSVCQKCKNAKDSIQAQENIQRATEELARTTEIAARRADANHHELMRAEKDRLDELQKQTQIMLEGQIPNEDAYQLGYELDNQYTHVFLAEDGEIFTYTEDRYLVERLNAAYRNGVSDRLAKELDPKLPGLDYVRQEAFGHGYARSKNCSIVYLHPVKELKPACNALDTNTEITEEIDQETGLVRCQWLPPYQSDHLNDAYEAGVQKYLDEQNEPNLVYFRLLEIKNSLKAAKDLQETLDEEAALKLMTASKKKRRFWVILALSILVIFVGAGIFAVIKNPDLANNPFQTKKAQIGMKVTDLGLKLEPDTAIYRYQKNLLLWGAFDKPGHPIFAIEMRCDGVNQSDQYEQIGGIKCGDSKDKVLKKFSKAAYEVCWDISDSVTSPIGIFYPKDGFFWGLDKDGKVSSMGKTIRKRYPVDEGVAAKCSELAVKATVTTPTPKPIESPAPSVSQGEIPPKRNIGEMTITFNPNVDAYYPSYSKRTGEEGSVVVRMIIDETGSVQDVALLQSSGIPRLDRAGVNIARDFKFKPSYIAGKPAAVSTNLMIKFNLKDKAS